VPSHPISSHPMLKILEKKKKKKTPISLNKTFRALGNTKKNAMLGIENSMLKILEIKNPLLGITKTLCSKFLK
jgi:hypothetical protein